MDNDINKNVNNTTNNSINNSTKNDVNNVNSAIKNSPMKNRTINDRLKNWVHHLINKQLNILGYQRIQHKRLSLMTDNASDNDKGQPVKNLLNMTQVNGLTKAVHDEFGLVMLKWQICQDCPYHSTNFDELAHESGVLSDILITLSKTSSEHIVPIYAWHSSTIMVDALNINTDDTQGCDHPPAQHQPPYWQFSVLTMPYYQNGSVQDYLKSHPLNRAQKHALLLAMTQTLEKFHLQGWVHGDIKPSNFLLTATPHTNDRAYRVVLTDFVLAHKIDGTQPYHQPCGTPAYLAPECWHGQQSSIQSDIYAFGIMMVEVLMDKRPLNVIKEVDSAMEQQNNEYQQWAVQHCQTPIPILPPQWHSYQPMITRLLAKHKHHRYDSMGQVMIALQKVKSL